ncbi:hypothetical protein [Roseateles sp. P5_E1]
MKTDPINFATLRLDDASIEDVRLDVSSVEVRYVDWQDCRHRLIFHGSISCFALSPHHRALSHGTVEMDGAYLEECCEAADEDGAATFAVFNFIDAWADRPVLRIVAENVTEAAAGGSDPKGASL